MKHLALCALTVLLVLPALEAKVLEKCDIVNDLIRFKFPRLFISSWFCLVQAESGGDTEKVDSSGAYPKYGLFQIDSNEYCGKGYVGGICNVKCESLLTDEMDRPNVNCAKEFYRRNGFNGWAQWESKCKQKIDPFIEDGCN